jgi:bacterial/archaeal transporter family-2 protein
LSLATFLLPLCGLLAAMLLPVQAAVNAQLARALGNPVAATAVSFGAGFCLLVLLCLVVFRELPPLAQIARIPPWLFFTGGTLGVIYLVGNVVLVPRLGAATLFTFAIAGQLTCALLLDQFGLLGLAVREISLGRVAGAVLVLVGAVMVRSL